MIAKTDNSKAKVAIFGIGLAAYWPQFDGLKTRLESYQKEIESKLSSLGANVISAGLVDDPITARQAGDYFSKENVDLIICYVATYATSSQVLPVVQRRNVPVLVLNLQATAALDYPNTDTAEWLANCSACCVPEISNAFARSRIQFNVITGILFATNNSSNKYYERAWHEIGDWIQAATAMRYLNYSRIGFLGHTYPGMLDLYSDFTMHHAQLGSHIEVLEIDDLHKRLTTVTKEEIEDKINEIKRTFDIAETSRDKISEAVTKESLEWSAKVACGLDKLVADFDLQGLAYYYRGLDGNPNEELAASVIVGNSLLTSRGIATAGEGDLKTCVAMMIMNQLNAAGSFTEFYALDFNEDFILMGHDGPGHIKITDKKPILRALGLFHGKRGYGLSVEFKVHSGAITILSLTQTADGNLKMVVAEGEAIAGPTMQIGNTNSRLKFKLDPASFMNTWCEQGPTHHCALGLGHQAKRIQKIARLMNLELVII